MTQSPYRVEVAGEQRLQQLVALDRALGGESREPFFSRRIKAIGEAPADHAGWLVLRGDSLCGYLLGRVQRGEFGGTEAVFVVDTLGVSPGEQGGGVGSLLLQQLQQGARDLGCHELRTQVSWFRPDLLGFFFKAGFTLASRQVLQRDTVRLELPDEPEQEPEWENSQQITIRSLSAGDAAELVRIDGRAMGVRREAWLQGLIDEVLQDGGVRVSMVAECDGVVVGYIMARVDYGSFGKASPDAVVDAFGVYPEYAGRSIGRRLMAQLLDQLAALRVERVSTEVEWNEFPISRFLAGCQFAPAQQLALGQRL